MESIAVIDLFAGAGGLGLGARAAGADVRAHVELDPVACETLRANESAKRVLEADVSRLTGGDLRDAGGLDWSDPLVVVGGPPCQPFSKAAFWSEDGDDAAYRRARARGVKAAKPGQQIARPDCRRSLVQEFCRLVIGSRADGFLLENVATLLAPRNRPILDDAAMRLRRAGFRIEIVRANAVEFGVPQRRDRLFVLGSRYSTPVAPRATHTLDQQRHPERLPATTCGPALEPFSHRRFSEPEEVVSGRWADHLRTVPPGWNYKAHTAWGGHPNPTFVTETRFWNFLLKLSPDAPSWTIAANPGPWTGPFHWETRRLRTIELSSLQTFPLGYHFAGTRRERVRQIGNAVPPLLASKMVGAVLNAIGGSRVERLDDQCVA
jgi:DNA (cytosine-5)-methyltransferase 1